jgi:hypothetical protein
MKFIWLVVAVCGMGFGAFGAHKGPPCYYSLKKAAQRGNLTLYKAKPRPDLEVHVVVTDDSMTDWARERGQLIPLLGAQTTYDKAIIMNLKSEAQKGFEVGKLIRAPIKVDHFVTLLGRKGFEVYRETLPQTVGLEEATARYYQLAVSLVKSNLPGDWASQVWVLGELEAELLSLFPFAERLAQVIDGPTRAMEEEIGVAAMEERAETEVSELYAAVQRSTLNKLVESLRIGSGKVFIYCTDLELPNVQAALIPDAPPSSPLP